jgi:hypothetical protein
VKKELKRTNDVEIKLENHFSEWIEGGETVPSYELDLVCFHITGIPYAWRHYPALYFGLWD